jgi:E3 ubiquitin-protein ligase HUWE1
VLNQFDTILEEQVEKYKLKDGPQMIPWQSEDKSVVIGVLDFTKLLVENCGNRSLYASSSVSALLSAGNLGADLFSGSTSVSY